MLIVTRDVTVSGPEPITVPAGTFTAMKVTTIITTQRQGTRPSPLHNVRWWALGVGCVKTVNFQESEPSFVTTFELTSYTIQ